MSDAHGKIDVENVNTPGPVTRVDAAKYAAMKAALLAVLPTDPPGMKVAEAKTALLPHLPDDLFPGGKTAGWCQMTDKTDFCDRSLTQSACGLS